MARKGEAAKEAVIQKIKEAFAQDFITIQDKKIYVRSKDGENGEYIQFAISLTAPKVPISANSSSNNEVSSTTDTPSIIDEDQETIAKLMRELGIKD